MSGSEQELDEDIARRGLPSRRQAIQQQARREARRERQRGRQGSGIERVARVLDERITDANIGPQDLVPTADGFKLRDDVAQRLAARRIDTEIEVDVTADDIQQTEDGEGFEPTPAFRRQQAALTLDEEFDDVDIDAEDVQQAPDGEGWELKEDVAVEAAVDQLNQQLADVQVEREDVARTDDGFALSEAAQREFAARDIDEQLAAVDVTTDDLVRSGDTFRVDDATSKQAAAEQLEAQLSDGQAPDADALNPGDSFRVDAPSKKQAARRLNDQLDTTGFEIRPSWLEATDDGGFRLRQNQRELIISEQLEAELGVDGISASDIEPRDDGGFRLTDEARQDLDVGGDGGLGAIDITADDLVESEDGFRLRDERQRELAARQIDAETPADVSPEDLVETDDGFALSEQFRREAVRESIVAENENVDAGDIQAVDELTPAERVDFLVEQSSGAFGGSVSEQRREELLDLAEQGQLDAEFEDVDIPTYGPEFTDDFRREQLRESLVENNEDIDPEDVTAVDELTPAERVEFVLDEQPKSAFGGGGVSQERRAELLKLAEQGQLDAEFENVDVPEFAPEFTDDFRRERAVEQLVESDPAVDRDDLASVEVGDDGVEAEFTDDFRREQLRESLVEADNDIGKGDIEAVSRLSPEERVGALIRSGDVSVGAVQRALEEIQGKRANDGISDVTEADAEALLSEFENADVPEFGPEFTEDFQRERVATQLDQEFPDREITTQDVVTADEGEGFRLREDVRREIAAEELDEEVADREISPQDLVATDDGGFRLSRTASGPARVLQRSIRENPEFFAAMQLDQQFEDVAIDSGDVMTTGDGVALSEDVQQTIRREQAADAFDAQLPDRAIGRGDVTLDGTQAELDTAIRRDIAAERLDEQLPAVDVTEADLREVEGTFEPDTGLNRDLAARRLDENIDELDVSGDDLRSVPALREAIESGPRGAQPVDEFRLDRAAQRELSAIRLDQQFSGIDRAAAGIGLQRSEVAPDVDIDAGDLEARGEGFGLDQGAQERVAAARLDRELRIDVGAEDVARNDGELALDTDAQRRLLEARLPEIEEDLAEDVAADLGRQRLRSGGAGLADPGLVDESDLAELGPDVDPDDLVTQVTEAESGPRIDTELSTGLQRRIATRQLQRETAAELDPDEDIQFGVDVAPGAGAVRGAVPQVTASLSASGRQAEILATARREGEIAGVDIREGEAAEQIQFDEQGRVVDVEERGGDTTEGVIDTVGGIVQTSTSTVSAVTSPIVSGLSRAESAAVEITPGGEIARDATVGGISAVYDAGKRVGGSFQRVSRESRELLDESIVEPSAERVEGVLGDRAGSAVEVTGKTLTTVPGLLDFETVKARSEVAVEALSPGAELFGRGSELAAATQPSTELVGGSPGDELADAGVEDLESIQPITGGGRRAERIGQGAIGATVGLPAEAISIGATAQDAAEFTGGAISREGVAAGVTTATLAAGDVTADVAKRTTRTAVSNPARTTGALVGGSVVGTALSPIRISRFDVPLEGPRQTTLPRLRGGDVDVDVPAVNRRRLDIGDRVPFTDRDISINAPRFEGGDLSVSRPGVSRVETDTTTLRGLRIAEPRILRGRVDFPGRTIGGARDGRPVAGTPSVRPERIDFEEFGGRGATVEPVGRFETDVLREVATDAGPAAASRFEAAENLAAQASRAESELELTRTEDIVREAEDVPEGAAPEIAEALEDVDATIFGSAAVRAQVPRARQPRDVDIAVDDPDAARSRLSEALDDTEADVGDVFDIKDRAERATPGEIVKLGRVAGERLETEEGVRVSPASDELLKKTGASAFVRGEGTPASQFPGRTGDVDVGPEPVAPGSFTRVKDPGDASAIAGELLQPTLAERASPVGRVRARRRQQTVEQFRDEFGQEIDRATAEQPELDELSPVLSRDRLSRLATDQRAQAGAPRLRTRREDAEVERGAVSRQIESPSPRRTRPSGFDQSVGLLPAIAGSSPDAAAGPDEELASPVAPVAAETEPATSSVAATRERGDDVVAAPVADSSAATAAADSSVGVGGFGRASPAPVSDRELASPRSVLTEDRAAPASGGGSGRRSDSTGAAFQSPAGPAGFDQPGMTSPGAPAAEQSPVSAVSDVSVASGGGFGTGGGGGGGAGGGTDLTVGAPPSVDAPAAFAVGVGSGLRSPEDSETVDDFEEFIEERPRSDDWVNPIERLAGGFR